MVDSTQSKSAGLQFQYNEDDISNMVSFADEEHESRGMYNASYLLSRMPAIDLMTHWDLSNMWTMHGTSRCILYTGTRITLTVLECHFGSLPVSNILAFMAGKLPQVPREMPTLIDWENHLTTIFPEVRLKIYLEMGGADGGPWMRLCALPAIWVGLLYDDESLQSIIDMTAD
ncbi:uncharacterized protein [Triticum aestivum]|uniref:uncharacterized protein n=1 Tax=Triticum aestivum TaxID=4565 RepID=UPI001D025359|nr:uncharacterized protein LOC123142257 [Triticum aestivum]